MRTAVVAGGTGLVGRALVRRLVENADFDRTVTLSRRPSENTHHRLTDRIADLLALGPIDEQPTDLFCCLGTTIKKAGSQEAFRKVDHDMIVSFARWGREHGADRFFLISSIGADPDSSIFYLRVKGETERDAEALGFGTFYTFRPGMIVGDRPERRTLEAIGMAAIRAMGPLMVGPLRRQHGVEPDMLARAMIGASLRGSPGKHVCEYDDFVRLAAG
jgi:uncharacterized protein YbjT (DUF2867 family)